MKAGTLGPSMVVQVGIVKQRLFSITILALSLACAGPAWSMARASGAVQLSPYAGVVWYLAGFELGPWEQYLVSEITPELERLSERSLPQVSWLQFDDTVILPEFAIPLVQKDGKTTVHLNIRQSHAGLFLNSALANRVGDAERFEQSLLMPGIVSSVSSTSDLTVSAVLARQRTGLPVTNLRLAAAHMNLPEETDFIHSQSETSRGMGLRFALSSEPVSGIRLEAAFQSRINMDEFASLRGVHGAGAQLDIPPRLQVGMAMRATERSWLNLGISQIFYSDISAFASRSLPARFNALLGDHNSPNFSWSDLTVYNLGWRWQTHDSDLELFADYRTRTQPRPNAASLASVLDSELAKNAFMAGLSKAVGQRSRLEFNASWAPPEYAFGGNLLGVVSDELGSDLEVQAMLSVNF